MDRKVFVAIVDSGHWAAECPKRGKNGQGGKGENGKGQGKKGKSGRGRTDDGKGKGKGGKWQARKAFERYCNLCWKRILSRWHKPRPRVAKATVRAVSMNLKQVDQRTRQLADLVWARLETVITLTGSGTIIAK